MNQTKMHLPEEALFFYFIELKCSGSDQIQIPDFEIFLGCFQHIGKHAKFVTSFIFFLIETKLRPFLI